MEPRRYPPPPCAEFEVSFTDGTISRVTICERTFPGEPSVYEAGARWGLSPERAASSWAWHQLAVRSINGDHTTGIAAIRRLHDAAPQ